MKSVTKTCLNCGTEFNAPQKEVNRGYGKYCSRSCSAKHIRNPKQLNTKCDNCGKEFYKSGWRKSQSKSGYHFCSRKCKDEAQRVESHLKNFNPPFYEEGSDCASTYRAIAFRNKEHKCTICGYKEVIEVLVVHHIDQNRSNNSMSNLEILCPTCHEVKHFKTKTGRWGKITN